MMPRMPVAAAEAAKRYTDDTTHRARDIRKALGLMPGIARAAKEACAKDGCVCVRGDRCRFSRDEVVAIGAVFFSAMRDTDPAGVIEDAAQVSDDVIAALERLTGEMF